LDNAGSSSPLWLRLACEELRVFGVFETVTQRIRHLSPSVSGLLSEVLERVRSEDTSGLLVIALAMLYVSATGLTEREMLTLLAAYLHNKRCKTLKDEVLKLYINASNAQSEIDRVNKTIEEAGDAAATAAAGAGADEAAADAARAAAVAAATEAAAGEIAQLQVLFNAADQVHNQGKAQLDDLLKAEPEEVTMAVWSPVMRRIKIFIRYSLERMQLANNMVEELLHEKLWAIDSSLVPLAAGCVADFSRNHTDIERRMRDLFKALQLANRTKQALEFLRSREGAGVDYRARAAFFWKVRCQTKILDPKKAANRLMCPACSMKTGQSSARCMNKMACGNCGSMLASSTAQMAGKVQVTLRMSESLAQYCPVHPQPGSSLVTATCKCTFCNILYQRDIMFPIILCMVCSQSKSCCHLNVA
jgi:hypothetical protein